MDTIDTRCCIAGGGPAGMVLGLLLARSGVPVTVLEKHGDFLRDFRGDTVHPSTLCVMHELGLLDGLLARPHQRVERLAVQIEGTRLELADFSHLPGPAQFIALMPQWEFLDFLAKEAARYPHFDLRMNAELTGLLKENGKVVGARVRTDRGELAVHSDLLVGADGRHSVVRTEAALPLDDLGSAIDVLWLRLPRKAEDPGQVLGHFSHGHLLVMIDRGDYWQCAYVIPKGGFDALHTRDIAELQRSLSEIEPFLTSRVEELTSWDDVKLLTVRIDRLHRWSAPGVLCIGDAAHAMSPIGGVGINLAIQDAVASANLLWEPLRAGAPSTEELARVQRRRQRATVLTQRVQKLVQDRVIGHVLANRPLHVPALLRLFDQWPLLRRLPARAAGFGVTPEHVRSRPAAPLV